MTQQCRSGWKLRLRRVAFLALCAGLSFSIAACKKKESVPQMKAPPPAPVIVGTVETKTVPVELKAIGTVEAYSSISVRSQVGGQLLQVHFTEGQDVRKGQALFTIDPKPYEAQVRQIEAVLARDKAQLDNAREEAKRYELLVSRGYVARDQYEQLRTNATALEATVRADEASLENAKLQLSYCYIKAPIDGRTGSLTAYQGNLIKSNADTPMVVINQIQPVSVVFPVPEKYLAEIKKSAPARPAVAALIAGEAVPEKGSLSFIDNAVDTTTGMIKLKASFPNRNRRLWPGQFVNAIMTLSTLKDAVVAPAGSVQTGQQGRFVFVVKEDMTAELRPVTAGISYGSETVIEKGLAAGEKVVTDGAMRILPGAKVEIRKPASEAKEQKK